VCGRTACTVRGGGGRKPGKSGQHVPRSPGASRRPYRPSSGARLIGASATCRNAAKDAERLRSRAPRNTPIERPALGCGIPVNGRDRGVDNREISTKGPSRQSCRPRDSSKPTPNRPLSLSGSATPAQSLGDTPITPLAPRYPFASYRVAHSRPARTSATATEQPRVDGVVARSELSGSRSLADADNGLADDSYFVGAELRRSALAGLRRVLNFKGAVDIVGGLPLSTIHCCWSLHCWQVSACHSDINGANW